MSSSTVSSTFKRLLSSGGRGRKKGQVNQQSPDIDGAIHPLPSTLSIPIAELPGDLRHPELVASVSRAEPSARTDDDLDSFEHHLETTASRWGEVQRHLLGQTFATIQALQLRSLDESDATSTSPTNSRLELAASKAMTLIHQYVDDVRQAVDSPGSKERMAQARLLMRQYRVIETEYIIRLQSSMEKTFRKICPDESISVTSNLNYLSLFTPSQHSPEVSNAMRTMQIRQLSLLDAKKRLTILGHLWRDLVAENSSVRSARLSGPALGGSSSPTVIAPNGDVVIEYGIPAIYKFRVSSQVLSQSSPFFDYALKPYRPNQMDPRSPPPVNLELELADTDLIRTSLTSPMILRLKADKHITLEALSTLFYAAHMRIDKVPRSISFQEFVDVASVCHKFRFTAPVELFVERVWLDQWIECLGKKGYEDFLFIAYVFGLERIFETTSKWAIMRLVSGHYATQEEESRLPWEAWLHLRVVQTSKLKEILHHCRKTLNCYLSREQDSGYASRPTSLTSVAEADPLVANMEALRLKGPTRCGQGSHQCDAANLGWVMLVLNEIGVLPAILDPSKEEGFLQWQTNSLKSILCKLCAAPSAVGVHGGACDYAPAFRKAMCNIYNGIKGLSIWDVNDRMRSRRGSAISQAGSAAFDEAGRNGQNSVPVRSAATRHASEPAVPTSNGVSLHVTNRNNRLSQQSNLNSDGNTSFQSSSDGNTDLTEPTDESPPPARLSRQNLEMLPSDFRSVVSTEVEGRTERYPSPTLTTHSVPTTRTQLFGGYVSEDVERPDEDTQGPGQEPPTLDSQGASQESAKIIWTQKIHKEIISRDDKYRILSGGLHTVAQGESSRAAEGLGGPSTEAYTVTQGESSRAAEGPGLDPWTEGFNIGLSQFEITKK